LVHHAYHQYSHPQQDEAFQNSPPINKMMAAGAQTRAVPPIGIKESRAIAVPQRMGEGRSKDPKRLNPLRYLA